MSIKKKTLAYIIMVALIIVSIYMYSIANEFKISQFDTTPIKADFFPKSICIFLAGLSVLYIIQVKLFKKDEQIELPNIKYLVISVIVTAIYLLCWTFVRSLFYLWTFLYMFVLLTVFLKKEEATKKMIIMNLSISAGTCVFTYLVFEMAMLVSF